MLNTMDREIETIADDKLATLLRTSRENYRNGKGISKRELARIAGVSRTYIMLIEQGKRKGHTSADILVRIANALEIPPETFLEAIGMKQEERALSEKLKLPQPTAIPIYKDFPFHAGSPTRPMDFFYRAFAGKAPKDVEGYPVIGTCLHPIIQEGDVIIVQRGGDMNSGDVIACRNSNDELHIGRLRKMDNEYWLENNHGRFKLEDCTVAAPVIEINRRIK